MFPDGNISAPLVLPLPCLYKFTAESASGVRVFAIVNLQVCSKIGQDLYPRARSQCEDRELDFKYYTDWVFPENSCVLLVLFKLSNLCQESNQENPVVVSKFISKKDIHDLINLT